MLLPREQSAWNCGYYLGAMALKALRSSHSRKTDISQLQKGMAEAAGRQISPTQVVAALAWLYLLDSVQLEDDGTVVLCD